MSKFLKVAMVLILLLTGEVFCSESVVIMSSGKATLNGKELQRSAVAFAGDEIATGSDSAVVLHANGYSVQVGPLATFTTLKDGLELKSGSLTATGLVNVSAANAKVFSDDKKARFVVSHRDGAITVDVESGPVIVRHGSERVTIKTGESRVFTDSVDEASAAKAQPRSHTKAALGAGIAAGVGVGTIIGSHLKNNTPKCISPGGAGCESGGRR